MKRFKLIVLIVLGTVNVSISQTKVLSKNNFSMGNKIETNFTKLNNQMSDYYDSVHKASGSIELVKGEKKYLRWNNFWASRSSSSNFQLGGDLDVNDFYLQKLTSGQITLCNSSVNDILWNSIGPQPNDAGIGVINCIALGNDGINTIYAGTTSSGMFKTSNAGASWTCITDNIKMPAMGVNTIDVDPNDSRHIIFASSANTHGLVASNGNGIYETFDGGTTWKNILDSNTPDPNEWQGCKFAKFVFHPSTRNIMYAISSNAFYKLVFDPITKIWTVNKRGNNFFNPNIDEEKVGSSNNYLFDIELELTGGVLEIYVSSAMAGNQKKNYKNSTPKLFYTNDEGQTWDEIINLPNASRSVYISLEKSTSRPGELFASLADTGTGLVQLYLTTDKCVSWQQLGTYPPGDNGAAGQHVLHVSDIDPNVMFYGESNLFRSSNALSSNPSFMMVSDYGMNSNNIYTRTHGDVTCLVEYHNNNQDYILISHDGGISLSSTFGNSSTSFTHLNGPGLDIAQAFSFDFNPITGKCMVGTQDNGTKSQTATGWSRFKGGDGTTIEISSYDPNNFMYYYNYRPFLGNLKTGINYELFLPEDNHILGRQRVKFDPINQSNLYIADDRIYKYNLVTKTYYPFSGTLNMKIAAFDVSQAIPGTIIATKNEQAWNNSPVNCILKSTNDGLTWTDITSNLIVNGQKVYEFYFVTDVIINPRNNNDVYLSISGFKHDAINNDYNKGLMRVIKSTDGGLTWVDFSNGLPPFPINCMTYQEGTDEVFYAGTDVGVYRYNKGLNLWQCFNKGLPMTIVTEIRIDNCAKKVRCSTYGRGIWEADLVPITEIYEIAYNTTWGVNTSHSFSTSIRVKSGATLTVRGIVSMAEGTRIIVEKGAKVFIEGGTITNRCGNRWLGIIVEGDPRKSQTPTSNQGFINIFNNSVISNSVNAISTLSQDYTNNAWVTNWNKTGGGIIKASNSKFTNNFRHIELLAYSNPTNNNDLTSFTNCVFEISGSRNVGPNGINKYGTMVTTFGVKGVRFSGCNFVNTNGSQNANFDNYDRGTGILTLDSYIIVDGILNNVNCTYTKNGLFIDLSKGIQQISSPSFPFGSEIKRQNFERNDRGIWMENTSNNSIHHNSFNMFVPANYFNRANSTSSLDIQRKTGIIGIYSKGSSGFKIESNSFVNTNPAGFQPYTVGQLLAGVVFENSNANGGAGKIRLNSFTNLNAGIQTQLDNPNTDITCNEFYSSYIALNLNPERDGLTPFFGECDPSFQLVRTDYGNTFFSNAFLDIQHKPKLSSTAGNIKTYIKDITKPNRPSSSKVNTNVFLNPCSKVLPKENCVPTAQFETNCKSGVLPKPTEYKNAYQQNKLKLQDTKIKINNGTLVGATATNQLNYYIREVIQSKSNVLWAYNTCSLYDTTKNYLDSVIAFLIPEPDIESRKVLVSCYYYKKQFSAALLELNSMNINDGEGTSEFKSWYTILCQAGLENRNIFQLNINEWTAIDNLSKTQTTTANSARGLLTFVKEKSYNPYIEKVSQTEVKQNSTSIIEAETKINPTLLLYPNPVDDKLQIVYSLLENTNEKVVKIVDMLGRVVHEDKFTNSTNTIELNTSQFNNGNYIVELYNGNELVLSKKFIIIH